MQLKYKKVPNYLTILKILKNIRYSIAEYNKYNYKLKQIGGDPDTNRTVAVDENLIVHENNNQVCLAGVLDTTSKAVRIDIIPNRNRQTLKYLFRIILFQARI